MWDIEVNHTQQITAQTNPSMYIICRHLLLNATSAAIGQSPWNLNAWPRSARRLRKPRKWLEMQNAATPAAAIRGWGRAALSGAAWAGRVRRARRSSPAATHHQGLSTWSADRAPLGGLIGPKSGRMKTCLSRRLCGGTVMRTRTDRGPHCRATCWRIA